ncbi:DUF6159 family protein [Gimesia panareensis]|uniref:Uncharacterized protein n=1 Tax=Gimesia panareensis TaxID=2527978 RepID=A0A518A3M0_9PLAN|nr:DUF6159 family protein [Gimesia panareensis]QDU49335.1 hypothetical protein Pan110_16550 [Gimesia panareensis]QDV17449.1 hypothetical protein Pan153_21010 [Gimesia panareensis]
MFSRISNGWALSRQSFHVLMLDKELLLFPIMSGISCLLVLATFALPLWYSGDINALMNEQQAPQNPVYYVILFAYYFVNYFVMIFFNSALMSCAIIRLKGGNPGVGDGFNAALSRLPQIAGWALVSATVGFILKMIESRSERLGQFVAGLLGMAWSITTYFVIPVLVVERKNPIEALKRSVGILRETWGESLVANFGIGMIMLLVTLPLIALIVVGGILLGSGSAVVGGTLIAIGILGILLSSLVSSACHSIVIAAIYLYAAEDEVPAQFDHDLIAHAFAHK